ncbi:MAG: hypothetical protein K2X75_00480 [Burkholderiaceae bacterium]|jgi:hypothetical protein|nr:hypothetical protein [Burkholderiaceae bacterium]
MTATTTSAAPATPAPRTATSTRKTARKAAPRKAAPAPQKKTVKTVQAGPKKKPAQAKAPKKIKRVRDSFAMPRDEYEVLGALKERTTKLGRPGKKSELLRAGLKLLAALNDKALLAALQAVPSTRTDRPGKA